MYQFHPPQQAKHQGAQQSLNYQSTPFAGSLPQRPRASAAIPIVAPPPPSSSSSCSYSSSSSTSGANNNNNTKPTPSHASSDIKANTSSVTLSSLRKSCRNIAIYGHCKFENEGCPFDHSVSLSGAPITGGGGGGSSAAKAAATQPATTLSPFSSPNKASSKPSASVPSLPSSPLRGALGARNAAAAVFVPKTSSSNASTTSATLNAAASPSHRKTETDDMSCSIHDLSLGGSPATSGPMLASQVQTLPSGRATPNSFGMGYEGDVMGSVFDPTFTGGALGHDPSLGLAPPPSATLTPQAARPFNPYEHMTEYGDPGVPGGAASLGLGSGIDYYGTASPTKMRQPLQYHLYAPPLPHVSNLHPHHLSAHAFFLSPNQREELQRKQEAMHASVPPPELGGPNLPEELHVYHSLVPLEHPGPGAPAAMGLPAGLIDPRMSAPSANGATGASGDPSKVFGYRSHCYKAICTLDGKRYVLRRLEGFRLQHEAAISLVERWRRIRHPSIVSVREAFTTRAFGDQSIVFVYDYHPLATTLYSEHMTPKPPQPDRRTGRLQAVQMQVAERVLWSYLCQLCSVIRCIHSNGLAARCIEPSKVLRTGKNRVRLNCCSIFDVVAYEPRPPPDALQLQQEEDLINLGRLMVSLCLNSMSALSDVERGVENIGQRYSLELKNLITWLLSETGPPKTAEELARMLADHVAEELDSVFNYNDLLENSLMKELENGRLVRLLCKFGFVNERPEFDHDPRWAETGDRYIIKLFRDYVFHAVDEAGRPVVDLSHILINLNKLDAGVEEKIMLTSRDEQSCLVVSYREIKNCIENAFQDLSRTR